MLLPHVSRPWGKPTSVSRSVNVVSLPASLPPRFSFTHCLRRFTFQSCWWGSAAVCRRTHSLFQRWIFYLSFFQFLSGFYSGVVGRILLTFRCNSCPSLWRDAAENFCYFNNTRLCFLFLSRPIRACHSALMQFVSAAVLGLTGQVGSFSCDSLTCVTERDGLWLMCPWPLKQQQLIRLSGCGAGTELNSHSPGRKDFCC